MRVLLSGLTALAVFSSSAQAQSRLELPPSSDWVLNYDDDSCALQRQFGESGQEVYLELRQFEHGPRFRSIVASPDFAVRRGALFVGVEPLDESLVGVPVNFHMSMAKDYEGKLFPLNFNYGMRNVADMMQKLLAAAPDFTDEERQLIAQAIPLESDSSEYAKLRENSQFNKAELRFSEYLQNSSSYRAYTDQQESRVTGITIRRAFNRTLFLKTGSMHAPMEAMRTCLDELMTHWGIDVEAHRTLSRRVQPVDQAAWAGEIQKRYPVQMLKEGMQGYLDIRLGISDQGKPTACHLQSPINDEAFESAACDSLMQHAKFEPALDAVGQPIASYYRTSIIYMINPG